VAKEQDLPQLAPIGPRATPKLLCALQNQLAIGQQLRRALDIEPVLFEAAAFKAQGAKGLRPCWGVHGGSLRMDSMPGFGAARDHLPDRMRNLQDLTPASLHPGELGAGKAGLLHDTIVAPRRGLCHRGVPG
jgi:hypothetical protein